MFRVGQSTDIHKFKKGNFVVIGGEKIAAKYGVEAHSDGDALIHAISEALLGAMGLKDLGTYFPDTEESTKGMNSMDILSKIKKMLDQNNYAISNIDSLVIIEKVKLAPHIDKIVENIKNILEIDETQISVKATRGESLGFIGKEEGYVAQAIVLIYKK